MRFSNARQLLVEFQLIPTHSLDFQVALNLGEPAPLRFKATESKNVSIKIFRPLLLSQLKFNTAVIL